MLLNNFYSVVSTIQVDGTYITTLTINKAHELYQGHFPGRPVTPGVILMLLFKEEAERVSKRDLELHKASNVKFTAVVDPNLDKKLILKSQIEEGEGIIILKGTAENNSSIAIKIQAVYKIKN